MLPDTNTVKHATDYAQALAGPFIAGFAVQQGVEVFSSLIALRENIDSDVKKKKAWFSVASILLSTVAVVGGGLDVLKIFAPGSPTWVSTFITIIFVSAGTEGFNSLLKWLGYKKEDAKATAAKNKANQGDSAMRAVAS